MRTLLFLVALLFSLSAAAEQVQVRHGELELNANLVKAGDEWTRGPVLLMTHGTLAHGRMEIMQTLQGLFAENGVSSLAPTLSLGLSDREGMYPCETPHTHRHTDALDEIALWLGWLKEQGVEDLFLLGHSRGGNQTAWFAAERPDPAVRGLILVAPGAWEPGKWETDYGEDFGKKLEPLLQQAQQLVDGGKGETVMAETDFLYCPGASVTAGSFLSYHVADPRYDTPSVLAAMTLPTLVFIGSEDEVVEDLPASLARAGAREGLRVETIDGADHFFRDLYADELVEIALEFIAGLEE
jgi:pimeloyl-ACP methyl ester carboxylesterase